MPPATETCGSARQHSPSAAGNGVLRQVAPRSPTTLPAQHNTPGSATRQEGHGMAPWNSMGRKQLISCRLQM